MRRFNFIYSFKEVIEELICLNAYSGQVWDNAPTLKNVLDNATDNIGMVFNGLPFITIGANDFTVNENVENLWQLLKARYYNSGFLISPSEIVNPTEEDKKLIRKSFNNLLTKIALTWNKYDKLLSLYASQANNLLAKIESSSSGDNVNATLIKRNETPQNLGDYSGDSHATEVSRNESNTQSTIVTSTDKDTPIMRLAEIQTMYQDLLADWSSKIERCFLEEEIE